MCGTIVVHVWAIVVMSDQFLYLDKLAIHSTPKALQDDDDDSDDSDDDEEGRKVPKEEREEHGSMGDIHVTYKITWTAGTVGGTLQAEADRLLQDLDGQQDEDLEEVPLLSVVAEAPEEPEETKETIKTKEIKETKETSTAAAASTTYDSTAPQWWYVASDQYRTVMGPYTGTAMAGWLRGGYFNGQLNV